MRERDNFLSYGLFPDNKISIEWVRLLPDYLNQFLLIVDAGFEPDDPAVRIGILYSAWLEHQPRCVIITRVGVVGEQTFAVSEKSLVKVKRLVA